MLLVARQEWALEPRKQRQIHLRGSLLELKLQEGRWQLFVDHQSQGSRRLAQRAGRPFRSGHSDSPPTSGSMRLGWVPLGATSALQS